MNKKLFYTYVQYIYFVILLLVVYQVLFCNIVYCDDGSINSTTNFIETFNLADQDQSLNNEEVSANCSTVFSSYKDIARRRIY